MQENKKYSFPSNMTNEKSRLASLLLKIAEFLKFNEIVLLPYFQDNALSSKDYGFISLKHFSSILHQLGILIAPDDYDLLIKTYIRNSYSIDYVKFSTDIDRFIFSLKENTKPKLVINTKHDRKSERKPLKYAYDKSELALHPVLNPKPSRKNLNQIIYIIQKFVLENQIRINEFFKKYDPLNSGLITKSQFIRGLDIIGISRLDRVYLTNDEQKILCKTYASDKKYDHIDWKRFEGDINQVFARQYDPVEITKSMDTSSEDYEFDKNSLLEMVLFKLKTKIGKRRIYIEPFFRDFDKLNTGQVSRYQMRQVLFTHCLKLTGDELKALEDKYNNVLGFNYLLFLQDVDPLLYRTKPSEINFENDQPNYSNSEIPNKNIGNFEEDLIQTLITIKGTVVRNRIRIINFLEKFDKLNQQIISVVDFRRGLDAAGIHLSSYEFSLIREVFKSLLRNDFIDYGRFCEFIEQAFYQTNLERAPLIVPLQHFPSNDTPLTVLNDAEKSIISNALRKLSKKYDQISNLSSIFQDYDKVNCGSIPKSQFFRALTLRQLNELISSEEFEIICKCFGIERGLRMEVDYRAFLDALQTIFVVNK